MSIAWLDYLVWAFVATLTLTGTMHAAQEKGLTRMAIPFLLGSAWTTNRRRVKILGFFVHLLNGWIFALVYVLGFESIGWATWWLGAVGGALHAAVVLTVGIPLLAAMHPYMADERHGPTPTHWLQPPGFLALNYGRRTPLVALVAHLLYGVILGGFYPV